MSGKVSSREIDCTPEQYIRWLSGESIQCVMPNVSASDREFIQTGMTDEEWDKAFKQQKEEDGA